jgi:hypothetical protein
MLQAGPTIKDGTSAKTVMLIVTFAAGLLISVALAGLVLKQPEVGSGAIVVLDPQVAFGEGLAQHFISLQFEQNTMQVSRGETVTIPFTIAHKSHSFWQWVTVTDLQQNVKNYVRGNLIEVDIKGVSPISAIIWPNSSITKEVSLLIPSSAPDQIVGKSVTISLELNAEVAFGGSYLSQTDSINLQVIK